MFFFISAEPVEEAGVLQLSDIAGGSVLDIDDVRSRLGMELRRIPSPSRWFSLKRSTGPYSDGRLMWLLLLVLIYALPGVDGGPRDDDMEEVEVAGDGGLVIGIF